MIKCPNGNHKFEPRYDVRFPRWFATNTIEIKGNLDIIKEKIYVKDVCIYCGEEICR